MEKELVTDNISYLSSGGIINTKDCLCLCPACLEYYDEKEMVYVNIDKIHFGLCRECAKELANEMINYLDRR